MSGISYYYSMRMIAGALLETSNAGGSAGTPSWREPQLVQQSAKFEEGADDATTR